LLAKAFAKVRGFFLTTKFFRSFFEKIFQRPETGTASPSRSLSTAKVRYKATTEKPETSRSLCQCFSAFLSRKRVQNYALFRKLQLLHDFFLTFPESFFVKRWKTGMLCGIFFSIRRRRRKTCTKYLLRGRAHVREGKHTALSAKSGTMEKQRLLFIYIFRSIPVHFPAAY